MFRYPVWQHTFVSPSAFSRRAVVSYWRKYVHEVLVNRLGGLSLPRKNVVRLTDRPDMTLDVYRGRETTIQQQHVQIRSTIRFKTCNSWFKHLLFHNFTIIHSNIIYIYNVCTFKGSERKLKAYCNSCIYKKYISTYAHIQIYK